MQKKLEQKVDLLKICVYSEPFYESVRSLWRGFVAYCLKNILICHIDELESLIASAIVNELEELEVEDSDIFFQIRVISDSLAESLGIPAELSKAAFLDTKFITRIYHQRKENLSEDSETMLLNKWIQSFQNLLSHPSFQDQIDTYNKWFEDYASHN